MRSNQLFNQFSPLEDVARSATEVESPLSFAARGQVNVRFTTRLDESEKCAIVCGFLSGLNLRNGELDEALKLNERAVAIMEKAVGSEHPHYARGLFAHALLLREMDRADEADELVRRARAILIRNGLQPPER